MEHTQHPIPGNHHVKRALEVAAVADVRLILVGHPRGDAARLASRLRGPFNPSVEPEAVAPCPCGCYGSPGEECVCDPASAAFRAHRAPLAFAAMSVEVARPGFRELVSTTPEEDGADVAARIRTARGLMPGVQGALDSEGFALLEQAYEALGLHPRDVRDIMRVSRAVAAMDGATSIGAAHLLEAIQYKSYGARAAQGPS